MKLEEIRTFAKAQGLSTARRSKSALIKSIQSNEGNFSCYATATRAVCDQGNCLWRDDCFIDAAKLGE
ncbi:hypothetical protein [Gallionella capsiferriformans]|jgi:hypothetical protein|uniref:SAP domain-containing protein n=1 Tax=Gallionella capsiferriformans (strain ES-2) TaxID=395494 RepID=D9SFV2_GALCS|nr:hypothetical protein [Gallionella capsiferriformans]ADL55399.1 hypothetical protein Galf_1373 [Gallionella capsiferriformans ES-2]